DPRPGRRVRVGQDHREHGRPRPAPPHLGGGPVRRRADAAAPARPGRAHAGGPAAPAVVAGPADAGGALGRRTARRPRRHRRGRAGRTGPRGAGPGRPGGVVRPALPAPALRRPAPAGVHRAGADHPAAVPRLRRGGERARRLGAGPDPQPGRRPARGDRVRRPVHLARPRRGALHRRPRRRHAGGHDRGDRGRRRLPRPAPARILTTTGGGTVNERTAADAAHGDPARGDDVRAVATSRYAEGAPGNDDVRPVPAPSPGRADVAFDIPGVSVGTAEYTEGPTGCTVIRFDGAARTAIDARGGAVGLSGGYEVHQAIVFAGGSVYGLEAAAGVGTGLLREQGNRTHWAALQHVSGAVVYDFSARDTAIALDAALGRAALRAARPGRFPVGRCGAGRSASVGKIDFSRAEFADQGAAYRAFGPVKVLVATVVNAVGVVVDRDGRVVRGNVHPDGRRRSPGTPRSPCWSPTRGCPSGRCASSAPRCTAPCTGRSSPSTPRSTATSCSPSPPTRSTWRGPPPPGSAPSP